MSDKKVYYSQTNWQFITDIAIQHLCLGNNRDKITDTLIGCIITWVLEITFVRWDAAANYITTRDIVYFKSLVLCLSKTISGIAYIQLILQ